MSVTTVTHLNFTGQARAALEFYAGVVGGEAVVRTYADFGMPAGLPDADKVVWGQVVAGSGFTVMAYDIPGASPAAGTPEVRRENGLTVTDQPFFISLQGASLQELTAIWEGLAEGATVVEPLAASDFSAGFGMLTDRFGVTWAVSVFG
ncbi:VOC family protein [Herbiconiux liangxiaofengii]|uniref:VOC family protein n=1 Tax=Herbiconiux liangxiaofengii TaxID=3342795 RepID=UPI0035B97733